MKAVITLEMNGAQKTIEADHGALLSDIINSSADTWQLDMPCAGKGICGHCVVYVDGLKCLACQTMVQNDMHVKLLHPSSDFNHFAVDHMGIMPTDPMFRRYGVAIDVGTTTICAALLDASGSMDTIIQKNPQTAFGADVVSRIEKALAGYHAGLTDSIRTALNSMISELCARKHISTDCIDTAVITGNTAMLYLLTGQPLEPLSRAPFEADRLFGEWTSARSLGFSFSPNARIYLPPCISAFVGADIVTAIIASDLCKQNTIALLADIGTNGEIALWHDGKLTCCSTAAGPAFEGMGISHGTYGIDGAIDHAWPENGRIRTSTIGGKPAVGICGSGMIDILSTMLKLGIMDETGTLKNGQGGIVLQNGIQVTASDIRKIQLAKGSIRAGIETLLEHSGLWEKDIELCYISGSFGSFIHLGNAAAIGLIPSGLLDCTKPIGNAAHTGAVMLLCDESLCAVAQSLTKRAKTLALSANPVFTNHYINHMMFA